jgi:hypothetical protein
MLNFQDEIALRNVFRGSRPIDREICDRLVSSVSIEHQDTGVGFYSTIGILPPLSSVPDVRMWELNFISPKFLHGGSYMCTVINETTLELEAVAFGGEKWPHLDMADQLNEIGIGQNSPPIK